MQIAFSINRLGMQGLGATLVSLLRNCADNSLIRFFFLCSGLKPIDKKNIAQLLEQEKFAGSIDFIDFDAKEKFGHLRPLQGDWTAYGRLLIPQIWDTEDVVLYLDADLLILKDILELGKISPDKILAAVTSCTVEWCLENVFFLQKLKWNADVEYFNSGVLLFNISKWKRLNMDEKLLDISSKYSEEFLSADQTLLNAACHGEFTSLPKKFNGLWYPGVKKPMVDDVFIFHFAGSPKPWDLLGRSIHYGYTEWQKYNTVFWKKNYGKLSISKLKRAWKIRRSIAKNLKLKLLSK